MRTGYKTTMTTDVTQVGSHVYWLWLALLAVATATLKGYMNLRTRGDALADKITTNELSIKNQLNEIKDCLSARIASNELVIKIQLAEIKTSLLSLDANLYDLKQEVKQVKFPHNTN